MIRNENGFTYPLSYSLFLVLTVFLLINAEQYLSEKKLLRETETILKQEYYMQSSVKKMEQKLKADDRSMIPGTFQYSNGKVDYKFMDLTDSVLQITFELQLNSGEEALGFGFYDRDYRKMIKWVEKN